MLTEGDKASYWNLSLKELSFRHNLVSPNILFIKCASHSMVKWQAVFAILAEKLLLLFLWWKENNIYTKFKEANWMSRPTEQCSLHSNTDL